MAHCLYLTRGRGCTGTHGWGGGLSFRLHSSLLVSCSDEEQFENLGST